MNGTIYQSSYSNKSGEESEGNSVLHSIDASGIAEYIRFDCCPRYFKLRFEGDEEEKSRKWLEAFKQPMNPLLFGAGKDLEKSKVEELRKKASDFQDLNHIRTRILEGSVWQETWDKAQEESLHIISGLVGRQLANHGKFGDKPVLLYQVPLKGQIGFWQVKGRADLIGIAPARNGNVSVKIFEIKSSWKEQTAHRVQVAIYALLLSQGLKSLLSNIEVEGGVINKETDLEKLTYDNIESFRLDPLIQDVKRLLCKDGELYRIHQTPLSEVMYQLNMRCDNCGFNECCIVRSVENESIALLNLTRGEQHALLQHGIKRLEDLARLKIVPDVYSQKPQNFREVPARDVEKVKPLATDLIIGPKLDMLIQRAQFMLGKIRPNNPFVNRTRWMPWLTGTGYGTLPEDSPWEGIDTALLFKPNGMIRVYFHIQWDYVLDILSMVSARVSCTNYRGDSISISKIVNNLPVIPSECKSEEGKMLEEFFTEVTKAINNIAVEVGSPDEAPIHLYFYTQHERDKLMEAVRRHNVLMSARAVRDLLGLRQAIDQPMFSIVQNDVMVRKAVGYHSTGLLPVLEQCGYFDRNQWVVKRSDGTLLDLQRAFHYGFFNFSLPYYRNPDGSISFVLGSDYIKPKAAGYYPARARFGNQIPIEYLWAAKGRLDNNQGPVLAKVLVDKRMWCDYPQKTRRITDEELTFMGAKLCLALEHIERYLNIRNRRLGKKPIPIPKIAEFTLGPATLKRSCREFLDLEYFAKRQEMYQHYALLPYQRVASGRSVIFKCTRVEETEREFTVHGSLVYEGIGLPNVDCAANACRLKGSDSSGSGDWLVVTEIKRNGQGLFEETQERSPSEVEKSARAIVDKVNLRKMDITIKVVTWPSGRQRKYSAWHNLPTTEREKAQRSGCYQLFEAGRTYILDELADDIISERAAKCLEYTDSNSLYRLLAGFLSGKNEPNRHTAIPRSDAESFLRWVEQRRFPPKPEQKQFVERIFGSQQIVLLQGPPGTGKTESLQLAVLAHIAAHKRSSKCRVLMVAPTHKAIYEFVSKLADYLQSYLEQGGTDLADLRIYRVLSSAVSAGQAIDGVRYLNYNEDKDAVDELRETLLNQVKLDSEGEDYEPLILCVTPPGMYGLMKKIGEGEPPWGKGFFDLLAVDEASMMRLPELILSGAFLKKDAQILVAGDHRQLPPIKVHNWEKEDRRTIEEMASFLSAQDFLRLLRQEDLGIKYVCCQQKADIPAERLSESHRCHEIVADFLREWVYHKDGIDFRSDQKQTLPLANPSTLGLTIALKPENVFVLIVHDEMESFQSNLVEAKIVEALVRDAQSDNVGIVTPHNAQRGLVKNLLSENFQNVRVDTVERYQGGEGDLIIISSTVSDPDYVRGESDFLLNLNRINVAVSRMKKKLVIVASKSIFQFMPQDAMDYDKALLWRGIAQTVGFTAGSDPLWRGTLSEFTGQDALKITVEVYAKSQ